MGDQTEILWTATFHPDGTVTKGATWNPLRARDDKGNVKGWACARISPACDHCYAETFNGYRGNGKPYLTGQHAPPTLVDRALDDPIRWARGRFIFVCSMTDIAWSQHPDAWLDRIWSVMAVAQQHTFLVLTKRSERLADYLSDPATAERVLQLRTTTSDHWPWPLPNVWIGATVENQTWAERRVPHLVRTPAVCRFLSVEPLVGPLDLGRFPAPILAHIDWLIAGGESGGPPKRALVEKVDGVWQPKPEALARVRRLRDQCQMAGIEFFLKQWGGRTPKSGGRLLDGREWNDRPGARQVVAA